MDVFTFQQDHYLLYLDILGFKQLGLKERGDGNCG